MENNKKYKKIWNIFVIIFVLSATAYSYISYRAGYLETLEIGEEYLNTFIQNNQYKVKIFIVTFIIVFLSIFLINIIIKKGLKIFFEDNKKKMPKLPNISLTLIIAIISGFIITSVFLEKTILLINTTWFGKADPIFGLDIGFYFFQKPFIDLVLKYIVIYFIILAIYTAIYYIGVFNIYLSEIDKELLLKSNFIKLLKFYVIMISISIAGITFINTYDIILDEFITLKDALSTKLIGAGITNTTIKLWGYRILSIIIIISVILILRYVFDNKKTKKLLISIAIVPGYLVILFIVTIAFNALFINNNKFDNEKEYIAYNIEYTKNAYNLNVEEEEIEEYNNISKQVLNENNDIIENIRLIDEETTLKSLNSLQTNSGYYNYRSTVLQMYKLNGQDTLMYVSPREIKTSIDTSTYNNKTYEYTHGYGAIITYANSVDENGNVKYVQKGFTDDNDSINIKEPRIYFGLENNNTIITNSEEEKEFDYPITSTSSAEYTYNGNAGIKLGFIDRLILSIMNTNVNVTFESKDSNIILNRNIINRAKTIMPYLIYDEEPYMIISDNGDLIWVLDAYTVSNEYPYSQKTTIEVNNSSKEINYIRNSVKVLIDAYNGTVDFYLMDETDPIAVAYSHAFTDLFKNKNEIETGISSHFVYPKYLYNIQSEMLEKYHNITADVLYRGDDIWSNATYCSTFKTSATTELEPYYTMIKDENENKIGLILPYTAYKKQNIVSYAIGTINEDGTLKLKIYKYTSGSNVLGPQQLDKEIEQDENISAQIQSINVTGTKISKNIIIVPINNSLMYIEPIYQLQLNEKESIPLLKKVVVAFDNKVAIGDTLEDAIENILSQSAVNIKVESTDTIENLIDSIIEANKDLEDSSSAQNFEMIGKDITKLQELIKQLEQQRQTELQEEKEKSIEENKNSDTKSISSEFNTENKINNSLLN